MKRIFLFLAAAAATLASCVKENTLAPEQTSDNFVTIKALAGETKTTVDGATVKWEADDVIAVILDKDKAEFAVDGQPDGAAANFVGAIASKDFETAYAIYPATAYSYDPSTTKVTFTHTLPAEQSGSVTTGMNLATAALSVEDLKNGVAEAQFHNALTLLKVTVPAGVKQVKFSVPNSKPALVGTAKVSTPDPLTGKAVATGASGYEVTLMSGSELDPAKTYDLLVYPANSTDLTLTMEGTDGAVYTSTVENLELVASTYRTINLTKIFNVETNELHVVLPAGGTVEVPVITAGAYDYQVSMSSGADSWITYSVPTKAFHEEVVVFNVAENTSGADREANVTITCGDKSKTFRIQQKNIFMDFVNDANGDPIQWEETFEVYTSAADASAGTNAVTTYENVFTIELSDDFSKGTYKVSNIFKTDNIWLDGPTFPNQGGVYYADYADNKLTIKLAGSRKSYHFSGNVVLTYDSVNKIFSADPIPFTANTYSSYKKAGFIGGYSAAVKVEEKPAPGQQADPIAGEWDVTFMMAPAFGGDFVEKTGTMSITGSNGNYVIESIAGESFNLAATYVNNTLTANKNGATLSLAYNNGTLTQDSNVFQTWELITVKGLVATKSVDLSGQYSGSGKYGSSAQYASSSFSDTFTIQKNNDGKGQYQISGLFCVYGSDGGSSTYYANYSGGTLTILAANSINHPYVSGSLQSNVTMSFSDGTFVLDEAASLSPYAVVASYSAVKQ